MIVFENKPSTKTPINKDNLNANFSELKSDVENINNSLTSEILYEDSIGTTGSINFSKSLTNYKYIDIYGYDNGTAGRIHKRIKSPGTGTDYIDFGGIFNAAGVNVIAIKSKRYNISEYNLIPNTYGVCVSIEINLISNVLTNNRDDVLFITKIVGYK